MEAYALNIELPKTMGDDGHETDSSMAMAIRIRAHYFGGGGDI